MPSKRSQTKKSVYFIIPLMWHARECRLIQSNRKEISGYLGTETREGGTGAQGHLLRWWVSAVVTVSQVYIDVKPSKLHTLSMWSLLYVNYTSVRILQTIQRLLKHSCPSWRNNSIICHFGGKKSLPLYEFFFLPIRLVAISLFLLSLSLLITSYLLF